MKQKIIEKQQKLEAKLKKLKEKERKNKVKSLIALGKLFQQAKLDHLDQNTLLGALIQLKQQANNSEICKQWKDLGQRQEIKEEKIPFSISFYSTPSKTTINNLRQHGFKWNRFRQEWYGYSSPKTIEALTNDEPSNIETLETL